MILSNYIFHIEHDTLKNVHYIYSNKNMIWVDDTPGNLTIEGTTYEITAITNGDVVTLSLPDNTSIKIAFDISVGISPLNNTFSSFTMSLPFRFVLPTFTQLNNRYGNLNQLENDLSEGTFKSNLIDYEFLEEQRANEQRRSIYQHIEILFKK